MPAVYSLGPTAVCSPQFKIHILPDGNPPLLLVIRMPGFRPNVDDTVIVFPDIVSAVTVTVCLVGRPYPVLLAAYELVILIAPLSALVGFA